jgi:DNA repair protein RadA/Sms
VSLTGAVRAVGHTDQRLKEAKKLGFARAALPAAAGDRPLHANGLRLLPISELDELVAWFGAPADEA